MQNIRVTPTYVFSAAFIFILALSLLVRAPHLERPLGIHGENASAHVLVTLKSYEQNAFSEHYFLPIYSYGAVTDKHINNMPPSSLETESGSYIYTSFSAWGFVPPYIFMKALGLEINERSLRAFNILLHLAAAYLLFITLNLFSSNGRALEKFIAVSGFVFLPEVMWSFSNAYWHHSLAQIYFMASFYFFARLSISNVGAKTAEYGFLASLFLLCITEWFGFVFAAQAFIFVLAGVLPKEGVFKNRLALALKVAGVVVLSLAVLLGHFMLKFDVGAIIGSMGDRAAVRGAFDALALVDIARGYWLGFGVGILALPAYFLLAVKFPQQTQKTHLYLVVLAFAPIVENVLLSDHARHYSISYLKLSLPIALSVFFLLTWISGVYKKSFAFLVLVLTNIAMFYHVNNPFYGQYFEDVYETPGRFVGSVIEGDEVGFVDRLFGHVVYYAGRHLIFDCVDQGCVEQSLAERGQSKAKVFYSRKVGLNDYDIPFYTEYFYGFHNGVVDAVVDYQMGEVFGAKQTPVNYSAGNVTGGVSLAGGSMLLLDAEFNKINLEKYPFLKLADNTLCAIGSHQQSGRYLSVTLEECQLSMTHAFPAYVRFTSTP